MKMMWKRFLAVMLAILLLCGSNLTMSLAGIGNLLVIETSAADYSGTCGENLTWTLDADTGILTISGTGAMKDYSFSSNAPWYSNRSSIRKVQIANGVTSIGNDAFSDCTSLTSITIPDSVTSIGSSAFHWCTSLRSVTIPDSVTRIGGFAFNSCTSLTSVTIPDSVTSIGSYAFVNCTSLTSVTIPDSVTSIGEYAFYGCTGLTSITVKEGNPNYSSDEYGVLLNKDKTMLIQYPVGNMRTSYTIPDSVTSIDYGAFEDCTSLTSITIPDSVTSIGSSAFCSSAFYNTGIYNNASNWENDVLYIGNHLIKAKESITGDYLVKSGTKTIADDAFCDCTRLTSVTIPDSVTSIGSYAFHWCTRLTSVTIPDSVTSIGDGAFWKCTSLTSITIPDSVTSIGRAMFYECTSLTSVTIPDSVTSIGDSAFWKCTSLTSVTIPDSVTSIGDYAFRGCTSLTSVTIPDSVTRIGWEAFYNCTGLTSVTIPDSVTGIGYEAFSGCTSLTSVTIPDSVTSIGRAMFYECTSLTSVTIPESVTSIGDYSFYGCKSLEYAHIPSSVTTIGDSAFIDCDAVKYICSDTENCYAKTYAQENEITFRVCTGHNADHAAPSALILCESEELSSFQTVHLIMEDNVGVEGYYWGTSSTYTSNTYTATDATSVVKTVSAPGTYYLTVKDTSGNVSSSRSITFYKTTLNAEGGSVTPTSVLTKSGNSFALPIPTRSGYIFTNWNTVSDGSGTDYTDTYTAKESKTLYAQWIYEDNEKPTGSIRATNNFSSSQTVTLSLRDNIRVAGYYWGTFSTYTNNTYTATGATSVAKTVSAPGTYYLTVKDTSGNVSLSYSITFYRTKLDANGGTLALGSVLTKNGNSFELPSPKREKYGFAGWATTSNGSPFTGEYTVRGNQTLYAQWKPVKPDVTITVKDGNGNEIGKGATVELYNASGVVICSKETDNSSKCTFSEKEYSGAASIVAYKDEEKLGDKNRAAARDDGNVLYIFRMHSMTIDSKGTWKRKKFTPTDMTLRLSSPRYLINLSLCYYYNTKSGDYGDDVKSMLRMYADCLNEASDGYVQLNKVVIHKTKNPNDFKDKTKVACKSDIRIEKIGDSKEDRIRSTGTVEGFFKGSYTESRGYPRIQMSKTTISGYNLSGNISNRLNWAKTLMHETGHYVFGLRDEYYNAERTKSNPEGTTWKELGVRPKGAPPNFGLMEQQKTEIEMSRSTSYEYVSQNGYEGNAHWLTNQYYQRGCSCWDWFAQRFSSNQGYALSDGVKIKTPQEPRRYSNDMQKVTFVSESTVRAAAEEDEIAPDYGNTPLQHIVSVVPRGDALDLQVHSLNSSVPFVSMCRYDENGYVPCTVVGSEKEYTVSDISLNDDQIATLLLQENGTQSYRAVDLSMVSGETISFVDHTSTIEYEGTSENGKAYFAVHQGGTVESGKKESHSHIVSATFDNVQAGSLRAFVSMNGEMDFRSLSWYKLTGDTWEKVDSTLSDDEHETVCVSAPITETGTYVVLADPINPDATQEPIGGQHFSAQTENSIDGAVNVTFSYADSDVMGYYVYYREGKSANNGTGDSFVFCDVNPETVTLSMSKPGTEYTISVSAKLRNGQVFSLGEPITVRSGEYVQKGSQIPYAWIAQYRLNEYDDQIVDDLDFDNDGFTNLQEYLNGTNPTVADQIPAITIQNFVENKTIDYRATIKFTATVENVIDGGAIHWFVDGQDVGTGDSYTVKNAKKDFTVQAKYMDGNNVVIETETEKITVKKGFFDKLKAFFRALFGKLPTVVQEYLGVEIIDRIFP